MSVVVELLVLPFRGCFADELDDFHELVGGSDDSGFDHFELGGEVSF